MEGLYKKKEIRRESKKVRENQRKSWRIRNPTIGEGTKKKENEKV